MVQIRLKEAPWLNLAAATMWNTTKMKHRLWGFIRTNIDVSICVTFTRHSTIYMKAISPSTHTQNANRDTQT